MAEQTITVKITTHTYPKELTAMAVQNAMRYGTFSNHAFDVEVVEATTPEMTMDAALGTANPVTDQIQIGTSTDGHYPTQFVAGEGGEVEERKLFPMASEDGQAQQIGAATGRTDASQPNEANTPKEVSASAESQQG